MDPASVGLWADDERTIPEVHMLDSFEAPNTRAELPLLIAFVDLSHFTALAKRLNDAALADFADAFYERIAAKIASSGGAVVKFIGDAALIVYAQERADAGVRTLLELKTETDHWLSEQRLEARLVVKVHFGTVIGGPFGGREKKQFDVIGREVNTAATLEARGIALSAAAFRRLSPETRKRFKKHTPPITYIPIDAPRP